MDMFCNQCEQTAKGKGCTRHGVCGKSPDTALVQDLLVHQLKGIGALADARLQSEQSVLDGVSDFVIESLFSTLTNVNFDPDRFEELLREAAGIKADLMTDPIPDAAAGVIRYELPATRDEMLTDAAGLGMLSVSEDEDIRSLHQTIVYGLKGMAAYAHHAARLGYTDEEIHKFVFGALSALCDRSQGVEQLLALALELGKVNVRCMEILDAANRETYGDPEPTQALVSHRQGPFIIVSGHDLRDLSELLEQTAGRGVNVYTHGEMLPALSYPELKRHSHLVGNYGSAWQNQTKEFAAAPGAILMTTNCLQRPADSYRERIFTTGPVGWPGVTHIEERDGKKDFTPVIERALELGGWPEDEPTRTITTGFGHSAVLSQADVIVEAFRSGAIKHAFLIGGCDGARPGRSYYTELAESIPEDCIILTLGCAKYRFNKLDLGTIGGIPRLLDAGQCNDAYSAVKIATALAEAFSCDVNELPLSLIVSWYEQKAVSVLLSLLALNIKNIRLGPTLPAFLSPTVLGVLVDQFGVTTISTVEEDLQACLQ